MKTTILVLMLAAGFSVPALGREIVVDLGGGGDFTAIQPAIDAAEDGDTVLVKPGEYGIAETIDFNRLHDPEDPNSPPVKNITLRSEAGAEETTIRMAEKPADPERASVVMFENGEGEESVLEGFTLTGGKGRYVIHGDLAADLTGERDPWWEFAGGGVSCLGKFSSPTLKNCTISGNSGSGVWVRSGSSSPTLKNCTISGNSGRGVWVSSRSC